MNEFDAFRLWNTTKLHFTTEKFDCTKSRGVRGLHGRYEKLSGPQKRVFKHFAMEYSNERELCKMYVACFLNGFDPRFGSWSESSQHYKKFVGIKKSLTYKLGQDFDYIHNNVHTPLDILQACLDEKITHESVIVFDSITPFLDHIFDKIEYIGYKELILTLRKYRCIFHPEKYKHIGLEILTTA